MPVLAAPAWRIAALVPAGAALTGCIEQFAAIAGKAAAE